MSLRHVLAATSVLVASLIASACSNQAEGERCDRANNDDDCQEGLICKPATELGSNADTCCPPGASELPECTEGGGVAASTGTGTGVATGATVTASSSSTGSSTGTGEGGGNGGAGGGNGGAGGGNGGAGGA